MTDSVVGNQSTSSAVRLENVVGNQPTVAWRIRLLAERDAWHYSDDPKHIERFIGRPEWEVEALGVVAHGVLASDAPRCKQCGVAPASVVQVGWICKDDLARLVQTGEAEIYEERQEFSLLPEQEQFAVYVRKGASGVAACVTPPAPCPSHGRCTYPNCEHFMDIRRELLPMGMGTSGVAPSQAHSWPAGLLDRVKAAEKRIEDNSCPRRIPADPHSDVDLVLAEVRHLIEGTWPPFWIKDAAGVASTPPPIPHEQRLALRKDERLMRTRTSIYRFTRVLLDEETVADILRAADGLAGTQGGKP